MAYFLCSYRPMAYFKAGRSAIDAFGLPPFIDHSIRKEPDFQSAYPSITALCRTRNFAPRLHPDDSVVYITTKERYLNAPIRHWRLSAILEIIQRFEAHEEAAEWYRAKGLPLPYNCMVDGNMPTPIDQAAPVPAFGNDAHRWDMVYKQRARKWGVFLACKSIHLDLYDPPMITDEDMRGIFGRIPGTQTPPRITAQEFNALHRLVD